MDRAYTDLITDLINEGDYESAQAALLKKVDENDGAACAMLGVYLFSEAFPGCDRKDAYKYWKRGAALGDYDCMGLCHLDGADLYLDEDAESFVLSIGEKQADEVLKYAAKGNGYIYEFLLSWLCQDHLVLVLSDRHYLRLITEGVEVIKHMIPRFLEYRVVDILLYFNQIPHTEDDFARLFQAFRDLLTEENLAICYAISAEILSFFPDFVSREELLKWISYLKEPLPQEYHYLMGALKDRDCLMKEVIIHAEEVYRTEREVGFGESVYAYCLLKGKGIAKDLRKVERLLGQNTYNYGLVMRAHCRMFIDPEHPDIEGAIALLDQAPEDMTVYWDKMLYLLYAESKQALTAPLKQLLEREMKEVKEDEYDSYLFLRGVQLALKPNVDHKRVEDCFLDERAHHHDLLMIWLCGQVEDFPLDVMADLVKDEHIDTDLRYHLAFRLVLFRAQQNDSNAVKEALQWVDSLGGQRYALRNRTLRYVLDIVGERDSHKRHPMVKRFLSEYDELKEEGLANYLRVWLEFCHFKTDRKRLKQFVDMTVASQDSYAIICVGHVLMHMRDPKDVRWGEQVEQVGLDISPFCRVDWMIEALTGGYYMDMFI